MFLLVLVYPGMPVQRAVKWLCACVCVFTSVPTRQSVITSRFTVPTILSVLSCSRRFGSCIMLRSCLSTFDVCNLLYNFFCGFEQVVNARAGNDICDNFFVVTKCIFTVPVATEFLKSTNTAGISEHA